MKALSHLNKYLYKYRGRLFLGFIFIILTNILAVLTPEVVRIATDGVSQIVGLGDAKAAGQDLFDLRNLSGAIVYFAMILAGTYVLLYIVKGIFLFFTRMTIIVTSRFIEYDLKNEIYAHYQRLNLAFYKRNNTGDLMNRISEDVSKVRMYLGPAIMYTANLTVMAAMVLVFMFNTNVRLTLFTLMPLPIMSFCIYYVSSIMNRRAEVVQRQQSKLSTMVQEAISGIRVLKAYNREQSSQEEFHQECQNYKFKVMRQVRVDSLFFPVIILLIGMSTTFTIYIGGRMHIDNPEYLTFFGGTTLPESMSWLRAIANPDHVTIGEITAFVFYINMLTWPFASLGWVTSLVQRAAASQVRINEFLQTKPEIENPSDAKPDLKGEIEFKNVTFDYEDSGIRALDNISFKVKAGETLAIIGRTGSGKSTITNLLLRQYDVSQGSIEIDGLDIREHNLDHLRCNIGYVPQEVFLFSDSIANNIAFGVNHDRANEAHIHQAAKDAAIYDNIQDFPEGFETVLGERGITLSGGQKQRVSIARALIRAPKMLFFDDCLSAVDTETEEAILSSLNRIMKGRTSIIISHRVSTVKDAEHIIVLDEGRIIEDGNHKNLIDRKGVYFELYQKQLLEEEGINH